MLGGSACMDGSQNYLQWYLEWARDEYPTGRGVIHALGEPVVNPWARAAARVNISRPHAGYMPRLASEDHDASFFAYQEFMVG